MAMYKSTKAKAAGPAGGENAKMQDYFKFKGADNQQN